MKRPNHATVVAYLALFVAVGTGGVYAADLISSNQIENNSIRSVDLKDHKAVTGKDVGRDTLTGREVREETLNGADIAQLSGLGDAATCNPIPGPATECATTDLNLPKPARVLVIATGDQYTESPGTQSNALCDVRIDGTQQGVAATPGSQAASTASGYTNGFARTRVTADPLPAGPHHFALACSEPGTGDVLIGSPTIAVLAIDGS
jgi:hypothetical protein